MISSTAWRPHARVTAFITNSIGEVDFLLPLLVRERNELSQVVLVFSTAELHQKFLQIYPLPELCQRFSINVSVLSATKNNGRTALFSLPLWGEVLRFVYRSDIIQIEQNGGGAMGRIVLLLAQLLQKTIQVHPHATNIEAGALTQIKPVVVTRNMMLLGHERLREVYYRQGFRRFIPVGFPKFYPEWAELLSSYNMISEPYALVFTRPVHPIWMPRELYQQLLSETVASVRRLFPNLKLILKLHPRENREEIEEMLKGLAVTHYEISQQSSMLLASRCTFAIGFFTSAVFDAYAFSRPAVDFYKEHSAMKQGFPEGRINRILQLDTADDQQGLENFLERVKAGTYEWPALVKDLKISSERAT